jgi:hypothetical protein
MLRFPFAAAGLTVVAILVGAPAAAADDSSFTTQAVPASLPAGSNVSVSLTFLNTGTTPWTVAGGYVLACPDPANGGTWRVDTVGLPSPVEAGASVTFTFRVTAPSTPGTYSFQWRMQHGTTFFGAASPNIPIKVIARPSVSSAAIQANRPG